MTITRHHDTAPALDAEEVFRFLGYNPNDPAARAAVGLCLRYQLDPFAGHIIVIQGRRSPYVTRDGHLWLAHRSGQFDGIETLDEHVDDKNCYAKVAVWRKDMSHPFVYTGRCPLKNDRGGWDHNADKKAVANAEVRALKRAFPLQLPSIVDYEDDLEGSGAGSSLGSGDTAPGSPAPAPSSPPSPVQEATQAGRTGDEGANQDGRSGADDGAAPNAPDATEVPESAAAPSPPGRRPSGTTKPARAGGSGRPKVAPATSPDEQEQAQFDQQLADPGRFAR